MGDHRDQWGPRDYPVLRHAAQLIEVDGDDWVDAHKIARTSRFSPEDAGRALMRLHRTGYIEGEVQAGLTADVIAVALTERGLREVGIWPDHAEIVQAFLESLEKAAELESDPEQRDRLQGLIDTSRRVGEGGLGSVLATLAYRFGELAAGG